MMENICFIYNQNEWNLCGGCKAGLCPIRRTFKQLKEGEGLFLEMLACRRQATASQRQFPVIQTPFSTLDVELALII